MTKMILIARMTMTTSINLQKRRRKQDLISGGLNQKKNKSINEWRVKEKQANPQKSFLNEKRIKDRRMFLRVIKKKRNLKIRARKAGENANKIIVAIHWIFSSNLKIPQGNVCKILSFI